jgi:hypothetical protein
VPAPETAPDQTDASSTPPSTAARYLVEWAWQHRMTNTVTGALLDGLAATLAAQLSSPTGVLGAPHRCGHPPPWRCGSNADQGHRALRCTVHSDVIGGVTREHSFKMAG